MRIIFPERKCAAFKQFHVERFVFCYAGSVLVEKMQRRACVDGTRLRLSAFDNSQCIRAVAAPFYQAAWIFHALVISLLSLILIQLLQIDDLLRTWCRIPNEMLSLARISHCRYLVMHGVFIDKMRSAGCLGCTLPAREREWSERDRKTKRSSG